MFYDIFACPYRIVVLYATIMLKNSFALKEVPLFFTTVPYTHGLKTDRKYYHVSLGQFYPKNII